MLVGVEDDMAEAIRERLNPIPVIRAAHLAAASERILVNRPLMVVVGSTDGNGELSQFRDVARGCGSEVVLVDELVAASEDVPRYLEEMVVSFARRRSGQFVAVETRRKDR